MGLSPGDYQGFYNQGEWEVRSQGGGGDILVTGSGLLLSAQGTPPHLSLCLHGKTGRGEKRLWGPNSDFITDELRAQEGFPQ